MNVEIEGSWKKALAEHFEQESFRGLTDFVRQEYQTKKIYPRPENIFKAFKLTPLKEVKVVIIGQDPYHGVGQAQGLSFSVPEKIGNPPSLQNIFKELEAELGKKSEAESRYHGDLSVWAKQGVLMLNAVLTVEAKKAGSHAGKGWEEMTDEVIRIVSEQKEGVVFLLWGAYARKKKSLIDTRKHLVLESAHPSPLSARSGFFGNRHFIKVNQYLANHKKEPINW